jgi:ABC-2 type transport system permease protein
VFVVIVGVDYGVEHDGAYLLLGIVLWSFFTELTSASVTSVVAKGDLLRKLNFPKYVIILSVAFSALINLMLNLLIVGLFMAIFGVDMSISFLYMPLLLVELFIFGIGLSFLLSTAYVKLRDVGHVWDVLLQAFFYLTPILFPLSFASDRVQKLLVLNPMAQIIQDARHILVSPESITITDVYGGNEYARLVPVFIVFLVFGTSAYYFKKKSKNFAEEI